MKETTAQQPAAGTPNSVAKLTASVDKLHSSLIRTLTYCYDALAADADQADRDKLREALASLIGR